MERKPIAKTLREMKVGDVVFFPLSQFTSVSNTRYRELNAERANGVKWSVVSDLQEQRTVVTRIA